MRVAREKSELDDSNRNFRRRKGKFYDWMVTGKQKLSPSPKPKKGPVRKTPSPIHKKKEKADLVSTDTDISPISLIGGGDELLPGIDVHHDDDRKISPASKNKKDLEVRMFVFSFLFAHTVDENPPYRITVWCTFAFGTVRTLM